MYVAQRQIKVVDRKDKVTIYKPGDVIPDFLDWNVHARRAHINSQHVVMMEASDLKKIDEEIAAAQEAGETVLTAETAAQMSEQTVGEPIGDPVVKCPKCDKNFKTDRAQKIHAKIKHG